MLGDCESVMGMCGAQGLRNLCVFRLVGHLFGRWGLTLTGVECAELCTYIGESKEEGKLVNGDFGSG